MNTPNDLLARARRALESTAVATLALAPLAMQSAQAAVLTSGDLTVLKSGAYFYNASGYFADWQGQPASDLRVATNPDGTSKLFGTASASAEDFMGHKCHSTPVPGCDSYDDRGVTMVWSGLLTTPANLGDRLSISVDFTVTLPDTGGSWYFGAQLAGYNLGNSNSLPTYGTAIEHGGVSEGGSYRIQGAMLTDELQAWQFQPGEPVYWQVYVAGVANAPWNERVWSDAYGMYLTPFRPVSITVPDHSIDVAHVDATFTAGPLGLSVTSVPEPGAWLLMTLGLGMVGLRARQRH